MGTLPKFVAPALDSTAEFTFPNVWRREEHPDWSRLVIGAREKEIPLILDLCRGMEGPFGVLYVLVASRLDHADGRYQSENPVGYDDLALFLYSFQEFLEQDGRHHLWVISLSDEGQFVFDNHNMTFAYGDLDRFETYLESAGFAQGTLSIPVPHTHNYHQEFDAAEDDLMAYWPWLRFPLEPDDNP